MADEDKKYRVIRKSSELSIRLSGDSLPGILADAGAALFDLLVDMTAVEARESVTLEVEGLDNDDLIVNWMRELLYEYQVSGYMLKEFDIHESGEFFVRAEARGEKFDPDRHEERETIGAVDERLSHLGKMGSQWTAQVSFEL
ncbi:MAG: archease [Deltaproteobacteria bacterium]|nr:archease [Deltaproteobacteria bacterium]